MFKNYKCFQIELMHSIGVIQMNPPPLNQVSAVWIRELTDACTQLFDDPDVAAIILTGRDRHFIGGMDVSWVLESQSCDGIQPIVEQASEFLFLIEKGPKPVIAAINANCTRGGMEVAMACHYRVASFPVRLGLLDVRFGLIPCMGGTQRLPRLIGIRPALELMAFGEAVSAEKAKKIGLIDEAAPPEKLLDQAVSAVQAFVAGHLNFKMRISCQRFDQLKGKGEKEKITAQVREKLRVSERGYLAPFKVVEAVESGLGLNFKKDLKKETSLFCECVASGTARNLITLFNQSRRCRHVEWPEKTPPRKIRSVGILGTGDEAGALASLLLRSGFGIWLWDKDLTHLRERLTQIRSVMAAGVENGLFSDEKSNQWLTERLKLTNALDDLNQADLVIECPDPACDTSRHLFSQLDKICQPDTVLAVTPAITPVALAARDLDHPERVVGFRFIKPLDGMPLLEIVATPAVSDEMFDIVLNFALKIGKTPLRIADGRGFFIPRLINALLGEFGHLVAEGMPPREMDALFTHFGFPIPLTRMADLIGMDALCRQTKQLAQQAPERWQLPAVFEDFCEKGWPGQAQGLGWYDYRQQPPQPHPAAWERVKSFERPEERENSPKSNSRFMFQILSRLINETAYMLEEGLSNTASELDMAVVYGMGFPPYHGGVLRFADSIGIQKVYKLLKSLESSKGKRFSPSAMIKKMAKDGKGFYEVLG